MTQQRRRLVSLGLASLLILTSSVALHVPAHASDVDDPNDQHGLGPYDQFACNGAEEDQLDTGDPNQSFFPPFKVEFNSNSNNNGGSLTGGYTFPFTDTEVEQKFNRDDEAATQPTVLVTVAPTEPRPGDSLSAIASLAGFADDGTSQHRQAAIAFAVNDISLQGILAGGKSLPEGSGSACGIVTRTPQTDRDGDGMDDTWETVHGLNPNDPSDAGADPDNDSAAQFFTNQAGEDLVVTPDTPGGPTGSMTNLAEYTWDTDPQRADTDKDGTPDGLEVLGFGGQTVTFPNTFPAGEQFTVRAYAVGTSLMHDAKQEFAPIVKLDSSVKTIASSNGEHLRGQAVSATPFTPPGQTARLEAHFVGTVGEPSAFDYTYIVDGQEVTNPLPSRDVLEVPIEAGRTPGTTVPVELRAVNKSTGQLAVLRSAVRVGEDVSLQTTPASPPPGAPTSVNAVLAAGTDPQRYLYEWRTDGELDEPASGVGRSSYTLTAPSNPGSAVRLGVQLYAVADGQLTGAAETSVAAAQPSVSVELVPAQPVAGSKVTGVAQPSGFALNLDTDADGTPDATQLTYEWVVDGTTLPPDTNAAGISTVNLSAGADGTTHVLDVRVRSTGAGAQAASGSASFTTLPGGTAVTTSSPSPTALATHTGNLVAAAIVALPPVVKWGGFGVALLGTVLTGTWVARRRFL